ncbi:endonuclease/exonuclease/phosphatase family protein [Gymnodinialimonas sp. 2305UL16-5]|uniref:endonuclease/exonuclease/phosphatase family protein n=1 Tax=Gymnodinialimonas mytili TaxID=3126503 RepID=UPI0030A9D179
MPTRFPLMLTAALFATPALADPIRVATFNASMNRETQGGLAEALAADDPQIAAVVEVIEHVEPDILLINEFDYDPEAAATFAETHLGGAYPHHFIAPSNTGLASGVDLNGDGEIGTEGPAYANDAFGFGLFEGQYGMLVLSRYPIDTEAVRTFQTFLWADMPEARLPVNEDGSSFYSDAAREVFRLSSKSHWDVPIETPDGVLHLLASHPTPPVFDGPEDRNGTRNADEIRFWADYIENAGYIYDDTGGTGGLPEGTPFVIAGDLNADPLDGDSTDSAAQQLLDMSQINDTAPPESEGGTEAAEQSGANDTHLGNPAFDTADFGDNADENQPGNLRVDYVLPSENLGVVEAGVYWPLVGEPGWDAAERASDHRLVWIDITLP